MTGENGIVLALLDLDDERPLGYRDEVAVGCRVSRMGRKPFDFACEMRSEVRQVLVGRGLSAMAAYDSEVKASIVMPERGREITTAYELITPTVGVVRDCSYAADIWRQDVPAPLSVAQNRRALTIVTAQC